MANNTIKLNCLIFGEDKKQNFPIRIERSQSVADLKVLIKEQWPGLPSNAHLLDLWIASIPAKDNNFVDKVHEAVDEKEPLGPTDLISEIFDREVVPKAVHIIVKPSDTVGPPNKPPRHGSVSDSSRQPSTDTTGGLLFRVLHPEWWGCPLDLNLTTLPTYAEDLDEEDPGSDLLPGEPFLKVITTFLVRAEYIRVFDQVKTVYDNNPRTHLAVVTGQPGIGKTIWIEYALRRCLGERQSVIWYQGGDFLYFSGSSVEKIDPLNYSFPPYTWCLVDSTAADRLPDKISNPMYELFPVYVTSLKEERWAKLDQLRSPKLVIMDPWTRAELEKAAILFPNITSDDISERFDNAGPSARLCLTKSSAEITDFYTNRDAGIKWDTTERLVATLLDEEKEQLRIGDISHKLCLVRRNTSEGSPFTVEPISAVIRQRLLSQLWEWKDADRANMIHRFSRVPGAAGMVGVFFESQCQHKFAEKIEIDATPMFRSRDARSRWHAAFGDFSAAPRLRKAQQEAASKTEPPPISLSISPSDFRIYNRREPLAIEENIYYVPFIENEVAIDSFIVHAGHLYMFQFASGQQHTVKHGLLATLGWFSHLPPAPNQHYIFVVPKHLANFKCPHSDNGFLHDHTPYVARVDKFSAE